MEKSTTNQQYASGKTAWKEKCSEDLTNMDKYLMEECTEGGDRLLSTDPVTMGTKEQQWTIDKN